MMVREYGTLIGYQCFDGGGESDDYDGDDDAGYDDDGGDDVNL